MAKKFKDYYNKACAELLADKIFKIRPSFNKEGFIIFVSRNIRGKEFSERQNIFAEGLKKFLDSTYSKDLDLFQNILGPVLKQDTGMFTYGWWLWPISRYIENYGPLNIKSYKKSLSFTRELTRRFTGEFAVRHLLDLKTDETLETMEKWSLYDCVHVRRLSSEGLRPKLPWAKKNDVFYNNKNQCIKILTNLIHSPEKFIQKSVANNINDIFKENQPLAEKILLKWIKGKRSSSRDWIIKHSVRKQSLETKEKFMSLIQV